MARKTVRVDRRRRDDDLQVRARGQQARDVAQDEVDVEAALVGLVDDERVVAAQHRVRLDLRQQDAVRHELDQGCGADLVRETHLVADHLAALAAHGLAQLVGDAVRDRARREPARLGVTDHAGHAAAQLHADFRQLRRLARARLARHDDHLVVADGARDLVAAGAHRQVGEVDDRDRGRALGELLRREGLEGARVRARARARFGLGGAGVRHDSASLVARHAGRAARGWWGSSRSEGAQTPQVACNSLGSVFECGLNPHDFNGLISNVEVGARELHATFLGNCWVWVWVWVQRAVKRRRGGAAGGGAYRSSSKRVTGGFRRRSTRARASASISSP